MPAYVRDLKKSTKNVYPNADKHLQQNGWIKKLAQKISTPPLYKR